MPTLIIKTNADIAQSARPPLLKAASEMVARLLGKPERYVMVILETGADMCFAGDTAPLAYLELKSLGLPEQRSAELSAELCGFVTAQLGVPAHRIYIEMSSPPRHLFGYDGGTF